MTPESLERLAGEIARSRAHTLLIGPPGSGKTMLARRVAAAGHVQADDMVIVSRIYRHAGIERPVEHPRPFRAPHHTVSIQGLMGRPPDKVTWIPSFGECSLAHGGVLFLDELPEFAFDALERLAGVLASAAVNHGNGVTYPARFQCIAAMNPCPCGYGVGSGRECLCTSESVRRYKARIAPLATHFRTIDLREVPC